MTNVIVDKARCIQCGICVSVCPLRFTFEANETKLPQELEKVVPFCTKCGHCEVFCPVGALKLDFAIAYAMVFGYPQYKIHRTPRRNPVKITWL